MAQAKTFDSSQAGQIPDEELESGSISTISFDGVDMPVQRVKTSETYFVLEPPEARPVLYAAAGATNRELLAFVDRRLPDLRRMRNDMIKRFSKNPSSACRYDTGDIVRVFDRPFMLRVRPVGSGARLKKASRGRATTGVVVDNEISLIELAVIQTGNYDQRRGAFVNWGCGVVRANAPRLCREAAQRMGVDENGLPQTFRTRPMGDALVKIDATHGTVWLSEDLVPLAPMCLQYAFALRLADDLVKSEQLVGDEALERRRQLVEAGCPAWHDARACIEKAGLRP